MSSTHEIIYMMSGVTTSQAARITEDGNVEVTGSIEIDRWSDNGDTFVWCRTCGEPVQPDDGHGLDDMWEVL